MLYGSGSEVVFGSHNWPTWGKKELVARIAEQRDMYGYLHDQTVRMMNLGKHCQSKEQPLEGTDAPFLLGMTGVEIAERINLPPAISSAWHCRGFYGSVSHNVKVRSANRKTAQETN